MIIIVSPVPNIDSRLWGVSKICCCCCLWLERKTHTWYILVLKSYVEKNMVYKQKNKSDLIIIAPMHYAIKINLKWGMLNIIKSW